MDTFLSLGFLLFCLGFFMLMTRMLTRDHREAHEQRVAEQREFGAPVENQQKSRKFLGKN